LKGACGSKEVAWNDELTCSGMIYRYAADGLDGGVSVATTVKVTMEEVCDCGMQCDECKVYNAMQVFVSDVEVREMDDARFNIAMLTIEQVGVIGTALKEFIINAWDNKRETSEEEDLVELYEDIRMAEELDGIMQRFFRADVL